MLVGSEADLDDWRRVSQVWGHIQKDQQKLLGFRRTVSAKLRGFQQDDNDGLPWDGVILFVVTCPDVYLLSGYKHDEGILERRILLTRLWPPVFDPAGALFLCGLFKLLEK